MIGRDERLVCPLPSCALSTCPPEQAKDNPHQQLREQTRGTWAARSSQTSGPTILDQTRSRNSVHFEVTLTYWPRTFGAHGDLGSILQADVHGVILRPGEAGLHFIRAPRKSFDYVTHVSVSAPDCPALRSRGAGDESISALA